MSDLLERLIFVETAHKSVQTENETRSQTQSCGSDRTFQSRQVMPTRRVKVAKKIERRHLSVPRIRSRKFEELDPSGACTRRRDISAKSIEISSPARLILMSDVVMGTESALVMPKIPLVTFVPDTKGLCCSGCLQANVLIEFKHRRSR